MILTAISPRLAINTLENMRGETLPGHERHPSRRLLDDQAQNYVKRLFYGAALVAAVVLSHQLRRSRA